MPEEQLNTQSLPDTIIWKQGSLFLLDQTQLPLKCIYEEIDTAESVWQAIYQLKVRGAPAIGVAAAYGLCVAIKNECHLALEPFLQHLASQVSYLDSSRPTAVNLSWALNRMAGVAKVLVANGEQSVSTIYSALVIEAQAIHHEDILLCDLIGQHGQHLIRPGMGILTHCNAGALATSGIGTATAPMYKAHSNGVSFSVYSDETRPLQQGSRLTSWELQYSGIDVRLITDNMAAHIMSEGKIDLVIVGSDRVAANGDIANKIGTLSVAINAKHFDIPFYVAFPSTTVDLNTPTGKEIEIEERNGQEVTEIAGKQTAPIGIKVRNPAFDVTPHSLISGFITEKGILRPPFSESLKQLFV